jgi:hypothetical protein
MTSCKHILLPILMTAVLNASGLAKSPGRWTWPEAGELMPALEGFDLAEQVIVIDYRQQGSPTVVYLMTPGRFVQRNEARFAALVQEAWISV